MKRYLLTLRTQQRVPEDLAQFKTRITGDNSAVGISVYHLKWRRHVVKA
jgi:hypothetical protein